MGHPFLFLVHLDRAIRMYQLRNSIQSIHQILNGATFSISVVLDFHQADDISIDYHNCVDDFVMLPGKFRCGVGTTASFSPSAMVVK